MRKHLSHPATVLATVALFLALGGGAIAYASGMIPGSKIKNHSISVKKLTNAAVAQLQSHPVAKFVTFDATATTAAPTATPLGTFLGMTMSAACSTSGGNAQLIININTPDGSWKTDVAEITSSGSATDGYLNLAPGTISSPTPLTLTAASGGHVATTWITLYQVAPAAGEMVWNLTADTNGANPICHLSIQHFPNMVSALTVAGHAPAGQGMTVTRLRNALRLGGLG